MLLARLVDAGKMRWDQPPHYRNDALGTLTVRTLGTRTVFDLGEWNSAMGSRTRTAPSRS
jgi:hypothetical protein